MHTKNESALTIDVEQPVTPPKKFKHNESEHAETKCYIREHPFTCDWSVIKSR